MAAISRSPMAERIAVLEENAGLHFLLKVDTGLSDHQLEQRCREAGVRVRTLGSYYDGPVPQWAERCLVVNYSGLTDETLDRLEENLAKGFWLFGE